MATRPLLYLSLPTVALIVGIIWYRHRNKISNATKKKPSTTKSKVNEDINENRNCQLEANSQHSTSLRINCSDFKDANAATKIFGKSAPIQIIQNGKESPVYYIDKNKQMDSQTLKLKIKDTENKVLRSIDEDFENLFSVDLPDSINKRMVLHANNEATGQDGPIVVKATKSPKISPENTFFEKSYVKENELNEKFEISKDNKVDDILRINMKEADSKKNVDQEKRSVDSPTLSLCSVHSGDSGKGSSLPRSEVIRSKTTYEFFFPNSLIGQLYGRKRCFIAQIKAKTSTNITLKRNPFSSKVKVCVIEGSETEINAALTLIRQRLPLKHYPNFTMQRIHFALPQTIVPLSSESILSLQLNLIEGINNDVVVSAIVTGSHIFVQQPLHPSHPSLAVLQKCLYESYNSVDSPFLPMIQVGAICVVCANDSWYRVQIVETDPDDSQRCVVSVLDFGGYINVHFNQLRQIKTDFMGTPFQATECILSNIQPKDSTWASDTPNILRSLTSEIVLQAQVAGYNSQNTPEIYLFANFGLNKVIFINKELVARGLAKWVEERN